MKKGLLLLIALFFFLPINVKANKINSIDMSIYVDANGDAYVTEIWDAKLTQGTEGYKPYYNLGKASITDFKVYLDGSEYTYSNFWNVNGSFNAKSFKNGINHIDDGLELCWGISKYGQNSYTLKYKINGFVSQTTDAQMIYWTLIPHNLSSKPGNVHIKIYSDQSYSIDMPVWGYGNYGGTAYVYDGYIEMNSEGTLNSDEYMTILVKFPLGTFNTTNILDNDFNYYYNMAEVGAKHYAKQKKENILVIIFSVLKVLLYVLFPAIGIFTLMKHSENKFGNYNLEFKPTGKKLPNDVLNYRNIPFNNDIYFTYWIATVYGLANKKTDLLGAMLLKWLKEGKISIEKVESGLFNKKETIINMTSQAYFENEQEQDLYSMMKDASKEGILESKEFSSWCSNNYTRIFDWFDDVMDITTLELIKQNKIVVEEKKMKIFSSNVYRVQPEMYQEAIKLKGFKNFLNDFSRIDDKEAIEVHMWEYYLIYAQILGIAEKVAKQFKKLYPEIIENYAYDYDDVVFINNMSYLGMSAASSTMSRANSYSYGGGGFSSGGGGGGSFGGGSSGGGGFR